MINTTGFAFPKPQHASGKITISQAKRKQLLDGFCKDQGMHCCTCNRLMTREPELMSTATLGHRIPQPAGCKKDDRLGNLLGAQCFKCNAEQGSKHA